MAQALEINSRGMGAGKYVQQYDEYEYLWIRYMNILSKNCMYYSKNKYILN